MMEKYMKIKTLNMTKKPKNSSNAVKFSLVVPYPFQLIPCQLILYVNSAQNELAWYELEWLGYD